MTLYHSRLDEPPLRLELFTVEHELVAIGFGARSRRVLERWLRRFFPAAPVEPAGDRNRDTEAELAQYLAGRRRVFDLPLRLLGTGFEKDVWRAVESIPYGRTATYREIAQLVGRPRATRAVGAANGKNPLPIVIPCHRVVGSNGSLTGYGGGLAVKRRLLALEGALDSPSVQMGLFTRPAFPHKEGP